MCIYFFLSFPLKFYQNSTFSKPFFDRVLWIPESSSLLALLSKPEEILKITMATESQYLCQFCSSIFLTLPNLSPPMASTAVHSVAAVSLNLPFQVLLHLHAYLTPFAITSQIGCFVLKFRFLYPTYRATLLALHFVSVLVQIARPFLGFHGNLKGRIPALSAFWILSALLHLPALLFLCFNLDIRPLPVEQFFYFIDLVFSSVELFMATVLIRRMANRQMEQFGKMMAEQQKKEEGTNQ